jgi:hypothetical protein
MQRVRGFGTLEGNSVDASGRAALDRNKLSPKKQRDDAGGFVYETTPWPRFPPTN